MAAVVGESVMHVFRGGMSKGDSKKFRESKSKLADTVQHQEHRRLIQSFDERIGKIRAKYAHLIDTQKSECRQEWLKVKAHADELFKAANAKLLEARRLEKNVKAKQCKIEKELLVTARNEEMAVLQERKIAEKDWQKELKNIERTNKGREKEKPKASAREARQESDQEVENNIEPHLVVVWHKVKNTIKANDRKSRTEAFLDWANEHGDVIEEIQISEANKAAEKLYGDRRGAKKTQQQFAQGPLGGALVGDKKAKPKAKRGPKPKNLAALTRQPGDDEDEEPQHSTESGDDEDPPF